MKIRKAQKKALSRPMTAITAHEAAAIITPVTVWIHRYRSTLSRTCSISAKAPCLASRSRNRRTSLRSKAVREAIRKPR